MVGVRIDEDLLVWFKEYFPQSGARQWFLESCMRQLKALHDENKFEAPTELIFSTVMEVIKDI